jgi:hypothetical protein
MAKTVRKESPAKGEKKGEDSLTNIHIPAPRFQTALFRLEGLSPYVQLRFSQKAKEIIRLGMEEGQKAKGKKRTPRNYAQEYIDAQYLFEDGSHGINASSFRNAMIEACRLCGFKMTIAKMTIFAEADGLDKLDGTPLVRIEGTPEKYEAMVRLPTGAPDLRVRAMWREWKVKLRVKWDADQFTITDVSNLLMRAGQQVGIGEGRPFSKNSAGMGFGTFTIEEKK